MSSGWEWDYKVPSYIDEKIVPREIPTHEDDAAYALAEYYGLYDYTSDVDDPSSLIPSAISSSVVGVSSFGLGFRPYHSSGIIVEHNRVKLILTSCYILGDGSKSPSKVNIILCNKTKLDAEIHYIDAHHNFVLLRVEEMNDETPTALLSSDLRTLGTSVIAVGRHYQGKLMASLGTINNRGDHLESDDLMSSTSNISEWGIGGALIDSSTGIILGMNFFSKRGYTPFMPSTILKKCLKHFVEYGVVCRPWLGLRTRSMDEVDIEESEIIYRIFQSFDGIVIKEILQDSAAEFARISVGDVIVSCNRISITSPAQLAGVLFRSVETKRGNLAIDEKRDNLKIELKVKHVADGRTRIVNVPARLSPPVPNRWPVLPIPNNSG